MELHEPLASLEIRARSPEHTASLEVLRSLDMARVRGITTAGTLALSGSRSTLAFVGTGVTAPCLANRSATSGTFSTTCSQQARRCIGKLPLSSAAAASPADSASPEKEALSLSDSVQRLRELLDEAGGSALALTGAGMSTDSGIPDYRGPRGSYSRGHKPMTHDEFLSTEANRKRYWARSTFGWSSFRKARPNAAHDALAALEAAGKVAGVITQNVDGLHQKAGSRNVVDLHGRNDKVECMSCQSKSSRDIYQADLARLNAAWIDKHSQGPKAGEAPSGEDPSVELTPDGDANVEPGEYLQEFVVPACVKCGGVLKPTVVFFGDNIPRPRVEETYRMVDKSNLLVAAGSSLQVYSAFRLVKRAADAGKTIIVVNLGDTRAERSGLDVLKVEGGVSSVLPLLL